MTTWLWLKSLLLHYCPWMFFAQKRRIEECRRIEEYRRLIKIYRQSSQN